MQWLVQLERWSKGVFDEFEKREKSGKPLGIVEREVSGHTLPEAYKAAERLAFEERSNTEDLCLHAVLPKCSLD